MKKIRFIWSMIAVLAIIVTLVACKKTEEPPVVEDTVTITLNQTVVNLDQGETFTLIATVINSEETVKWDSSNKQIATVTAIAPGSATVTAIAPGSTTVTASVDDKVASATIHVSAEMFPVLTISQDTVELVMGGEGITVVPEVKVGGEVKTFDFTWSVKDPLIAKVTNGLIEPLAIGETEVKVSISHNEEVIEKVIKVIVSVDASVVLPKNTIELDLTDFNGEQKLEETIEIKAVVLGETVANQTFTIELDNDIVTHELDGTNLTITSVKAGNAKLTISFMYEGIKIFSILDITVSKMSINLDEKIYYDLTSSNEQLIDFSSLGITETVLSVLHNQEVISDSNNTSLLLSSWINQMSNGTTKTIVIDTEFISYSLEIIFEVATMGVNFELTADNDVGATYTYDETTKTYTYKTGEASAWNNRIESTQTDIQLYEFMIFDIELTDAMTGDIIFWMDMALGDINVSMLKPNGSIINDRLFIFDENKELVAGSLLADVNYTFVIKLGIGDPEGRYSLGIAQDTTVYIKNPQAATENYVLNNFDFGGALKESKISIEFLLTEDNAENAQIRYSENDLAYEYITGSSKNSWESRIETNDEKIRLYDYIVFDIMLTQALAQDVNLWMDNTGGSNLTTLHPDGTRTNDRLYIFDSNKELVTGTLGLGLDNIYTFVIRLGHGEIPGGYGIGFNEITTVWLRNMYAATAEYIKQQFNIDTPSGETDPEPLEYLEVELDFVDFEDPFLNGASATITKDGDVYTYNTGSEGHWDTRLHIQEPNSHLYKYFVFGLELTSVLTGDVAFWMDMSSVTVLPKGSPTVGKVSIYDENYNLVSNPLEVGKNYTVVVTLGHSDERHGFGFMDNTTIYIKNPLLANQDYVDTLLGEAATVDPEPNEIDTEAEVNTIEFSLTEDNNVGATYDYNDTVEAFVYLTGVGTNAWSNRIQIQNEAIGSFTYLVFDMMLSEELEGNVVFWMDMADENANTFFLTPEGAGTLSDRLYILNEDGELITNSLSPNQIYTFIIKLGHGDPENRYAIGFSDDTTVYMRNIYISKTSHIESNFDIN